MGGPGKHASAFGENVTCLTLGLAGLWPGRGEAIRFIGLTCSPWRLGQRFFFYWIGEGPDLGDGDAAAVSGPKPTGRLPGKAHPMGSPR